MVCFKCHWLSLCRRFCPSKLMCTTLCTIGRFGMDLCLLTSICCCTFPAVADLGLGSSANAGGAPAMDSTETRGIPHRGCPCSQGMHIHILSMLGARVPLWSRYAAAVVYARVPLPRSLLHFVSGGQWTMLCKRVLRVSNLSSTMETCMCKGLAGHPP